MTSLKDTAHPNSPVGWRIRLKAAPYAFLAPFLLLFVCLICYPLTCSFALAFEKTAGPRLTRFAGLTHFRFMLHDWLFWVAIANTFAFTVAFLAIQIPVSLALALALNHPRVRARGLFRFAFFSSNLVGQAFAAVLFSLVLAPHHGLLDRALAMLRPSLGELDWRADWRLARLAILIAAEWLSIGYAMIYFLAALQQVDKQLYDAALADGAGPIRRFWHITLPQIRPVLIFLLVVGTISSLSLFELPFVYFQGAGPGFAGLTIVTYLFEQGFGVGDLGYASAVAWVLVLVIGFIALLQLRISGFGRDTA